MAQFISKNNKRKYGLRPGYTPKFYPQATDEATIPMYQNDGSIKYITKEDLKWLIDNNLIEPSS